MTENPAVEPLIESLQSEVDALKRELHGAHEMLAHVLLAIGEPVIVPLESVANVTTATHIRVDQDVENEQFIFYVVSE